MTSMKGKLLAAFLLLILAIWAHADTTVKATTSAKGVGWTYTGTDTTYIKGNKMRIESVLADTTGTAIYDLDAQKMYFFDSKKKEADVWDMAAFAQKVSKKVDRSMKASFKPNGQSKQIGGLTAAGYDMAVSLESAQEGRKMTVTVIGPVWIVKDSPGQADYDHFYKSAAAKGLIISNPRAAKAKPGQTKAMAEVSEQISASGELAYEIDMELKIGPEGTFSALMGRLDNASTSSLITSVETGPLSDDLFLPPPDYILNLKK